MALLLVGASACQKDAVAPLKPVTKQVPTKNVSTDPPMVKALDGNPKL